MWNLLRFFAFKNGFAKYYTVKVVTKFTAFIILRRKENVWRKKHGWTFINFRYLMCR